MRYERSEKNIRSTTRRRIIEKMTEYHGVTKAELSRELGLTQSMVNYHIEFLKDFNMISRVHIGRRHYYYPSGNGIIYFGLDTLPPEPEEIFNERNLNLRETEILTYLRVKGKKSAVDIRKWFGMSRQLCFIHLKSLMKKGLIKRNKDGSKYIYRAS